MRIKEIAAHINNADIVVDIGSDHALLSLELIQNNKAKMVFNLEKNYQPYLCGLKNTKQYPTRIKNLMSDGLSKFDPNIVIDYCVIAGLGGLLMIEILKVAKNKINNLILVPNNNEALVRNFAFSNDWKCVLESYILDKKIVYPLIWLSKDPKYMSYQKKDISLGSFFDLYKQKNYLTFLENKLTSYRKFDELKNKNSTKYTLYLSLKNRISLCKLMLYLNI